MTHSYVTWHIHVWYDSFTSHHIWVMSHINESCHMRIGILQCVVTHTNMNGSFTYLFVTTHRDMSHSNVTWSIHSYVTWLIHVWHDSFICDMTHSYMTWVIHTRHDSFKCNTTHSYLTWGNDTWHDADTRGIFVYHNASLELRSSSISGTRDPRLAAVQVEAFAPNSATLSMDEKCSFRDNRGADLYVRTHLCVWQNSLLCPQLCDCIHGRNESHICDFILFFFSTITFFFFKSLLFPLPPTFITRSKDEMSDIYVTLLFLFFLMTLFFLKDFFFV